ncbi:MAG TPA: phosphatase PAP2 family protein [Candidatus Paceibacterota bacterium]|jgi:membrane-associated phospholipid phosphatase|nr:phosphatase PAP2 family protein [Candidatus Paceibacterota bacterium]
MSAFFYKIFQNIAELYKKRNLLWQIAFIILTYIFVNTGFDWIYYRSTRGATLQSTLFPAVILGFLIPVLLPVAMFLYSAIKKSKRMLNAAYAIIQAGLLGLGISSLYKVFTGRMGPPHFLNSIDTSRMFRFGFLDGGAFQGWPSSHTSVAFAMSVALFTLFPENKFVRYGALLYALYIGIGVSVNIHWFSDFIAGAILGTMIGIAVGKSFLERYKEQIKKEANK